MATSKAKVAGWPLVGVLLASLLVDLTPRFHLEDSAAYLSTQLYAYLPQDRAWTYGLAISALEKATGWFRSVALAQVLLSWAAYAFFGFAMTRALELPRRLAFVVVAIGALEPLGYYWSRAFMSDSPAQSAFVFLCGVLLLRCEAALRFILVFVAGFILISLRTIYFLPVLCAMLAAAEWSLWCAWRDRRSGSARAFCAVRGWGVAALALLCANLGYAAVNALTTRSITLATNVADAQYLMAVVSPLAGDRLDSTPLTKEERSALPRLTYTNRNTQLYDPHGLVSVFRGHYGKPGTGEYDAARPAMQQFVADVVSHHPFGFAYLVLRQWGEYLDAPKVLSYHRKGWWSGTVAVGQANVLTDGLVQQFADWAVKPVPGPDYPSKKSFGLSYFKIAGGVWSFVSALYGSLAIVALGLMPSRSRSPFLVFASAFSLLYMGVLGIAADGLITRYLMPLTPVLIYTSVVSVLALRRSATAAITFRSMALRWAPAFSRTPPPRS